MQVDVWSDFVCPWCFLVSTSLEKLKESHGVEVIWHSYELRPKGSPPVPAEYRARIEAHRPQMEAIALKHYGIQINSARFGINSRPALIGAKFAEHQGKGDAYHQAMFRAYWQEAQAIDDLDVLAQIAESLGLDRQAYLESLNSPELEGEVDADIAHAQMLQISGVPALVFNDRYYIPGAQPYSELVNIIQYIRQKEGVD